MSTEPVNSSRALILGKVKKALATLKERAPLPEYDPGMTVTKTFDASANLWSVFSDELQKVHGEPIATPSDLTAFFQSHQLTYGYCDPSLLEMIIGVLPPGVFLDTSLNREKINDYQFGITRASGAIAETGTVILSDKETSSRLGALAPWVHIACLQRRRIYATLYEALQAMPNDPNVIWCTGPSKTADIEGILVEGVHGPGVQAVYLIP